MTSILDFGVPWDRAVRGVQCVRRDLPGVISWRGQLLARSLERPSRRLRPSGSRPWSGEWFTVTQTLDKFSLYCVVSSKLCCSMPAAEQLGKLVALLCNMGHWRSSIVNGMVAGTSGSVSAMDAIVLDPQAMQQRDLCSRHLLV